MKIAFDAKLAVSALKLVKQYSELGTAYFQARDNTLTIFSGNIFAQIPCEIENPGIFLETINFVVKALDGFKGVAIMSLDSRGQKLTIQTSRKTEMLVCNFRKTTFDDYLKTIDLSETCRPISGQYLGALESFCRFSKTYGGCILITNKKIWCLSQIAVAYFDTDFETKLAIPFDSQYSSLIKKSDSVSVSKNRYVFQVGNMTLSISPQNLKTETFGWDELKKLVTFENPREFSVPCDDLLASIDDLEPTFDSKSVYGYLSFNLKHLRIFKQVDISCGDDCMNSTRTMTICQDDVDDFSISVSLAMVYYLEKELEKFGEISFRFDNPQKNSIVIHCGNFHIIAAKID